MIEKVKLETERLTLVPFKEEFLNDFYEYAKVPGVGECAGWPHHKSIEESKKILDIFIRDNQNYALIYKDNNKCIGSLGIMDTDLIHSKEYEDKFGWQHGIEIGYVLNKDYWGRGLMTEAVKKVIDHLFKENLVDVIIICHYDFNHRSDRVVQKCGLHYWFTVKNYKLKLLDEVHDDICFYIEKDEYLKNNPTK